MTKVHDFVTRKIKLMTKNKTTLNPYLKYFECHKINELREQLV